MVSLDRNMHGATLHPDIIVAYRRCCICRAQSVTVKQSFPGQGQANKLTPTRSTVLRQSLLLAVSPMTPRAACSQAHSAAVNSSVTLRTGAQIPAVGLGVFLARYASKAQQVFLQTPQHNPFTYTYSHLYKCLVHIKLSHGSNADSASGVIRLACKSQVRKRNIQCCSEQP